jgi:hypothetical protein
VTEPAERDIGQDDRDDEQHRMIERHRRSDDYQRKHREGRERAMLEEPVGQLVDDSAALDYSPWRFLWAQGMHYSGGGCWVQRS